MLSIRFFSSRTFPTQSRLTSVSIAFACEAAELYLVARDKLLREFIYKDRDVFAAFSKRRNINADGFQAEIKILAEVSFSNYPFREICLTLR